MEKKNLRQKLLEVSRAIKYLKKDKRNTGQNYNYLSEAKIKEIIKAEFEKQGVLFNYSTEDITQYEISPTHKGTKQFVTNVKGTYRFIDADDVNGVHIDGTWAGSGMDTGDKGLYKAITGGIKYVLNTNFLIPSGDDPENDDKTKTEPKKTQTTNNPPQPEQKPAQVDKNIISEPQWRRYKAIGKNMGWKDEETKELIGTFGYEHSKDIQRKDYNKIIEMLEKGIARKPEHTKKFEQEMEQETKQNTSKVTEPATALETKALELKSKMFELTGGDAEFTWELKEMFQTDNVTDLNGEQLAEFVTHIANKVIALEKGE